MKTTIDLTLIALIIALWVMGISGYVMNIVYLIASNEAMGVMIARGIGIVVPPLGALFGWVL